VLVDAEGLLRLGLPMYIWFRVLDEGWMLLWSRGRGAEEMIPTPVLVQLLNVDHLRRLADLDEWLAQKPLPVDPHFLIAPEFYARVEISTACQPRRHALSLPSPFDRVPEFFVVAENPTMTLIPVLERLLIRDLIRRGEREGRKIEAIREKIQVKLEKKNHAR
jgi:hypothetical protein